MQITINQVRLGPDRLEKILLLQLGNKQPTNTDKGQFYKFLIRELVNTDKIIKQPKIITNFCLAYFYQEAATNTKDSIEKKHLYELALANYEIFIQNNGKGGEEYFYACFAKGLIAQSLGYPWAKIEQVYLEAYETNPFRAEPIARIIYFYILKQFWPCAYIYTSLAKDLYLDNPPRQRQWGIDHSLYSWKILDLHTVACFSLGKREEASATFAELYHRTTTQPEIFTEKQIEEIIKKKEAFPELNLP